MKRVINGKTYSKVLGIKQGSLLTAGKDGDIEEYKADVSDAGKVLAVGEDGGIVPSEGGGKLYRHTIYMNYNGTGGVVANIIMNTSEPIGELHEDITDEERLITYNKMMNILLEKFGNNLVAGGSFMISSGDDKGRYIASIISVTEYDGVDMLSFRCIGIEGTTHFIKSIPYPFDIAYIADFVAEL